MRLPALAFLLVVTGLAQAAINPAADRIPFTAQEVSQGFRDTLILAQPKAGLRAAADAAEAREGRVVRAKFPRMGDLRIIELAGTETPEEAIARLRASGRYEFVEPDFLVSTAADVVEPNESSYTNGTTWGLKNLGNSNGILGADIDAAAAWHIIREAPNVIVAVVDTGVNLEHQDLVPNLWVNPAPTFNDIHGARFINGLQSGTPSDDNGHGTHLAGTIGAVGDNGIGVAGVAWRVKIMAVKSFNSTGRGSMSDIVSGINYAVTRGAHIINASFGIDGGTAFSQAQLAAISAARDAGVIFVAAAGNSGANVDLVRAYPANHPIDNILAVGNSTRRDELSLSSNYGAAVDLFAPGSEILSLSHVGFTGTTTLSGTSMAAPHVAGALALLKARFPNDSYRQLMNRLLRGAEAGARFAGRSQTGGRLNLLNALTTTSNRPFNDDFAARPRFTSTNLAIRASNTGGTAELGEPTHTTAAAASSSLWWEWVSPVAGTVTLSTSGSAYDTVLAVYTGSAVNALTPVAANDDAPQAVSSRLTFIAEAGVTYQFAVDGKNGAGGLTLLTLGTTPTNDIFASAATLSGVSTLVTTGNANCSRETGEPTILGWRGGLSLWYRWTAPRTGRFDISAYSANFDPLLGVFTGTAVDALTYVAESAGATSSVCAINAVAGTTYSIVVDARDGSSLGQFTLSLTDSLWQANATDPITSAPTVGGDGSVYFGSTDNSMYAVNSSGNRKWSFATVSSIDVSSAALAGDGTLYVGTGFSVNGALHALTPTGTQKWAHYFGASLPAANSPAVAADGTIYIKPSDGFLYALQPATGAMKWRYDVGGRASYSSPSIAADGTIYIGSENRKLYAINPDGTLKWEFTSDSDIYTNPAIDGAGNIYFSVLNSGRLYSLTPAGTQRWVYSGASLGSSSSAALSADGATVYFGGYDAKLHAVNTATGAARWTYPLGGEVRASSPAVDAQGVIYIGCYDYQLYAINADGTLKRTWHTGNIIRSSPAIAGQTLYIGSNDQKLYAFDIGAGPAVGPWPQYRQNARRLGRALLAPVIAAQPTSQATTNGGSVTLSAGVSGDASLFEWQRNGTAFAGGTTGSLAVSVSPATAGIYTTTAGNGTATTSATSSPAIIGVLSDAKVAGTASEVGADIVHANGNIYDQILLQGTAATIKADANQVVRMSFIDLQDDIVQVEFSGNGALSVSLENATGPAAPVKYNQSGVSYMRGHASIVVAGADETTHLSVFSVGRANAVNQALFRTDVVYDGHADLASIAILSPTGKFGGLRTANGSYFNTKGFTGIYAPDVQFTGPVFVGNISAAQTATPVLRLGNASDVRITGGDLLQTNGRAVQVSGFTQLRFVDGTTSHGTIVRAQANRARLEQNGADITTSVVVNPAP